MSRSELYEATPEFCRRPRKLLYKDEVGQMEKSSWAVHNYCVAFIDLLGQRKAYENEGLLPSFGSEEEKQGFMDKIDQTIGAIFRLQESADKLIEASLSPSSSKREKLPKELQATYDEIRWTKLTQQRWSDGLVFYASLADTEMKCPMNSLFRMFAYAGSLCLFGLVQRHPLRGAIDIAWAVELHEGELYGAAIAKAYEYESIIAQYPRIVVSDRTIGYLETWRSSIGTDVFSNNNRTLAELCLSMLRQDSDGYFFLHYLGEEFIESISKETHPHLYSKALEFIQTERERVRHDREVTLALRYNHLLTYFLTHPPSDHAKGTGD